MMLWTGDLGEGPCPARPALTSESQEWLFKHGALRHPPFQPQHLTWKLGSETQRKCTVGRPKGKASGGWREGRLVEWQVKLGGLTKW